MIDAGKLFMGDSVKDVTFIEPQHLFKCILKIIGKIAVEQTLKNGDKSWIC